MPTLIQVVAVGVLAVASVSVSITAGVNHYKLDTIENKNGTNATAAVLMPPLYNNITKDMTWVYPTSDLDLSARDMSCECFDPTRKICPFYSMRR